MKRPALVFGLVFTCVILFIVVFNLTSNRRNTRLSLGVRDAVSGGWIWDATITLANREMRLFYQSDTGDPRFIFTGLKPGIATLEVRAPHYQSISLPVRLRAGLNILEEPILLQGLEIPDLATYIMVERRKGSGIEVEIRPVNSARGAIPHHPCLDIWVGFLASEQLVNGNPASQAVRSGASRGRALWSGNLPWRWDSAIEEGFRYRGFINGASFADSTSRFVVIDYLVLVPDPMRLTKINLERIIEVSPGFENPQRLLDYLKVKSAELGFKYYTSTSWNVDLGNP